MAYFGNSFMDGYCMNVPGISISGMAEFSPGGFIILGFPSSWAAASTLKVPLVTISSPSVRPLVMA
jgi:hypothetical protein